MNSVGDANCIFLHNCDNSLVLDLGFQRQSFCSKEIKNEIKSSKELLISHYHSDHYKGLDYFSEKSLRFKKLYYPYIPCFPSPQLRAKLIKELHFVSYIQMLSSGSKAFDLIHLLKNRNIEKFDYQAVYKGMQVWNEELQVIWPPKDGSLFDIPQLENAINKIEQYIKEIPAISKLWEVFDRFEVDLDNGILKNDYGDSSGIFSHADLHLEEYTDDIKVIDKKIRSVTNRFSVCLYKKDILLFLGDLEKEEVLACVNELVKENGGKPIVVKYFITPHHGTKKHYVSELESLVKADYVISSNGESRFSNYEESYNMIGRYTHCTHKNGDFFGICCPCMGCYRKEKIFCKFCKLEW